MPEHRLPAVDYFRFALVEAPLETVCRCFRGEMLGAMEVEKDEGIVEGEFSPPYTQYSGEQACIEEEFGYIEQKLGLEDPNSIVNRFDIPMQQLRKYPVYGDVRMARVACNPKLTLVESYFGDIPNFYEARILACFAKSPVMLFRSTIFLQDNASTGFMLGPHRDEVFCHQLDVYDPARAIRSVNASIDYAPKARYVFEVAGKPVWFEDPEHYERRLIRDRLNRAVMCEYLEKLGVDPEQTIRDRALLDPILLTRAFDGDPVSNFPEDLEPFRTAEAQADEVFRGGWRQQ